jgi:DNA-binding NarL/FixJ family response regulator
VSGLEVTQVVKSRQPQVRILMLTGIGAKDAVRQSMRAGVEGYILKNVSPDILCSAIRTVRDEGGYLHPAVAHMITDQVKGTAERSAGKTRQQRLGLTQREIEILQLMATSQTNRDIETVRTHVKRILRKLDQHNRTQAVLYGLKAGIIWLE